MRVVVVGAGLGGLVLAHGLREAGIDVEVVERDGPRGRPQGVTLHIDERGTTALRACLPPGHAAMAESTMGALRERTLALSPAEGGFAVVGTRPLDGAAGRTRPGRPASRRLLRDVLLTGLEDVVRFGAAFDGYAERPDGTLAVRLADGRTTTADVLVGADGIGSAVRRLRLPRMRATDTGRRMLMGATPLRAAAGTGLPDLIGGSAAVVQVGSTTMVLSALRFGCSPAVARHRWLPALPLDAVADVEDHLMWALPIGQDQLGTAGAWDRARALAADLHPALATIVDAAWPEVAVALRIGVVRPEPAWPPGPVTLIGDALHAAPGFGGNLAMQDAHRLRDALAAVHRGERDLLEAIGAHEEALRAAAPPPRLPTTAATAP